MPQANKYIVKCKSTYGKKGQVVELNTSPDSLTERQKVLLAPYKEPEVKKLDEQKKETAKK